MTAKLLRMNHKKLKIGIVGCGAIGSRIARSVSKDLSKDCQVSGLFDIDTTKSQNLEKALKLRGVAKKTLRDLVRSCDLMVEAVNAPETKSIIKQALEAKCSVLAMSVGKILHAVDLFKLAKRNKCSLLIPSGAIAGIDAIKAASLVHIDKITLTTRKPPTGFGLNPYFEQQRINLTDIKKETTLFEGDVETAVKFFPQNINVAATIALASHALDKLTIRIMTSPDYKVNSHEIEVIGDFGRITTKTENVVCPDNPRTSYLAVLSGIQTLKQYCAGILVGT